MKEMVVNARLAAPVIRQGYMTLDAILMAELQTGDVSHLIKCVEGLYYASAAFLEDEPPAISASFVASMRADRTPEWLNVIKPNTKSGDVAIGDSRAREAGNVISTYKAIPASYVVWYATGDMDGVLEVVSKIGFIGKRRNAGYGQVTSWSVVEGEIDGVVGYLNDPLRPIPATMWEHGGNQIPIDTAWKAPYWSIQSRDRCYAPDLQF